MAVTKLLLDDPPSADSSSVDGESESETVNHRREDKNDDKEGKKNSSKSESESESESEKSYTTPPSSGFAVKPVDPKPSPKRKISAGGEESSSSSSSSEEEESKNKKKKKKKKKEEKQRKLSPPPTPSANGGTARLWSEDDEIAILEALSDYRSEKGSEPRSDAAEFHGFVRPRLSVEVSKGQLYEKVRRLKKKYLVAAAEGGPSSSSSSSPKPRDLRRFELSKKFWGAKPQNHAATTPTKKKKKEVDLGEFRAEFPRLSESWRLMSGPIGSESLARKMEDSMPLIRSSKAKQLEKKWKQLEAEEVELRLQRSELARQTYQLILDAVIKPEH